MMDRNVVHPNRNRRIMSFGRNALGIFIALTAIVLFSNKAFAVAIPSNFFTVVDSGGANDVNSEQVDLTQMGRDDSSPNYYELFWSWDTTDFTSQTGNACALFDTDGDSNINYAVCVEIQNVPSGDPSVVMQTAGSPLAVTCSDAKDDRCTMPSNPHPFTSSDIQTGDLTALAASPTANLVTDTDPFQNLIPDQHHPNDSTIRIKIRKGFLPVNAVLANVCSYPSEGRTGNNNPFDCVVNPGGGFLKITKVAPNGTTEAFNFTVNPGSINKTITGSGTTGGFAIPVATNYSVAETIPANWKLDAASCTLEGGGPTGSKSGNTVSGIAVQSGKITTCTFTNSLAGTAPALALTKSSDANRDGTFSDVENVPGNVTYPHVVPYQLVIVNNSGTPATISAISDDKTNVGSAPSTTSPTCASLVGTTIGANTTLTCYYNVSFANNNTTQVVNTATVTATNAFGTDVKTDTATVNFPKLTLNKIASPKTYSTVGEVINYTYILTNTGNVVLKTPYAVSDNKVTVTCPSTPSTLAIGSSVTCTATHNITQADLDSGSITNIATATAKNPDNTIVTSNQDTETVNAVKNAALTLNKIANPTIYDASGDVINYTYILTNSGNVTLNQPFAVSDNKTSVTCPASPTSINPGSSITCTATYNINGTTDISNGFVTNVATATAKDPQNLTVTSNQDTETVKYTKLTLNKIASPKTYNEVGDVINYSYILTNSGNVVLKAPFVVSDDKATVTCPQPSTLAIGSSITCSAAYTITQVNLNTGSVTNVATATAKNPDNTTVTSNQDTETVTAVKDADLTLNKIANPKTYDSVGDVINYTYILTNSGNVTLYQPFTVADNKTSVTCPDSPASVAPGSSITCTAIYTITQADLNNGSVTNIATGNAKDPQGQDVPSNQDTETVVADAQPLLSIIKTGTTGYVEIGETVYYTITVKNIGNVDLHDVTVKDAKLELTKVIGDLAVNESYVITDTYGPVTEADVPGPIFNTAVATGTSPIDEPVGPVTDTHNVPVDLNPNLAIVKTGTTGIVEVGDTVNYTITVKNTGDVTLSPVRVTDSKLNVDVTIPSLAVNEVYTITETYGPVKASDYPTIFNTAIATGTSPEGPVGPVDDEHDVDVDLHPGLVITKTGTEGPVEIGDIVYYTITVQNTGDVALSPVKVTDAKLGINQTIPTLAVNQVYTITDSYGPVKASDYPTIFNTAVATGTSPEGPVGPVDDDHDVDVDLHPGLAITKTGTEGPVEVGDIVHYTITVKNTGDVALSPVKVQDAKLGLNQTIPTLDVNEVYTITDTYGPVQASDYPTIFNTAVATGTSPEGPVGPVDDDHNVDVDLHPGLVITKTGTEGPVEVGDTVYYTITVQNTGDVALSPVRVKDTKLNVDVTIPTLAVNEVYTITDTYGPVKSSDYPTIFNTAVATGTSPEGPVGPVDDDHDVDIKLNPGLVITKNGTEGPVEIGDMVYYTITVQNTGNVTLSPVHVTDSKLNVDVTIPTLAVNEVYTITDTYGPVKASDYPTIFNTAVATGTSPQGPVGPVDDDHDVDVDLNPGLVIIKTGTEGPVEVGDIVYYTITVQNTGDVALSPVRVTDAKLNVDVTIPTLAVNEVYTITDSYGPVTAADYPTIFNTAIATGTSPEGELPPEEDDHDVDVDLNPGLVITKTGTEGPVEVGDMVSYTITVQNTGDVVLSPVRVTDTKLNVDVTIPTLAASEVYTITDTYGPVAAADYPTIFNTAVATGTSPEGPVGPVDDDHNVDIDLHPGLIIEKTGTEGPVEIGDTVYYTITVQNTGDVALSPVKVTDAKLNVDVTIPTLAVNEVYTITDSYGPVTAEDYPTIFNTAIATGTSPEGELPPEKDDHDVDVDLNPGLVITKTGTEGPVQVGDMVSYTITVQNTGDVALSPVRVTDAKLDVDVTIPTLGVNEVYTITDTYGPVTAADYPTIFNTAIATGTSPQGELPPVKDDHDVDVDLNPGLVIAKTGTEGPVNIGDTVYYTITVQNTGDVALAPVQVTDAKLNVDVTIPTLAVNEVYTITDSYGPVTTADYPTIFNTAIATGTSPEGELPPDEDEHDVDVDLHPALIINKTGTEGPVEVGDMVNYTITVQNTGDVELSPVRITDAKLNVDVTIPTLGVNEVYTITDTYGPVTAADYPTIFNTAVATGTSPEGELPPVKDDHDVDVDLHPGLVIIKTGTVGPVHIGDMVNYTITVENTGDVALSPVRVTDAKLNVDITIPTLAVNEIYTITESYGPVSASDYPTIFNTAIATGTSPEGELPPGKDDHNVPVDAPGTIGDKVWSDVNANGIQDQGEPGIGGVSVTLYGPGCSQPTGLATTTDANGFYTFTNVEPGEYCVKFDISALGTDYAFTTPNAGNEDVDSDADPDTGMTAPFTITSGGNNLDVDAGVKLKSLTIEAQEVCIQDAPYLDYKVTANNFNPGENPVTITWRDVETNDVITSTTGLPLEARILWPEAQVDENGNGIAWPGWIFENGEWVNIGSSLRPKVKVEISVNPTSAVEINYPPASPFCNVAPRASVGDRVWKDDNRNGIQDAGEAGVPGVTVALFNSNDEQVGAPQVTDVNGTYLFTHVIPGNYYVTFDGATLPAGYTFTRHDVGAAAADSVSITADGQDDIDSDALVPWLEVTVSNNGVEPEFGKPLTFTIAYTNSDSSIDASNVVIAKTISQGTRFVPGGSNLPWNCPNNDPGTTCTLTLPTLLAGASGSATFTVMLGDDELSVPEQLVTIATLKQAGVARTAEVTLVDGEENRSLDAGIVLVEASLTLAGPIPPTSLPETDQPKQQFGLFLPSLSNNSAAARSSNPEVEPQGDAPQTEETPAEEVQPQNSVDEQQQGDAPQAEEVEDEESVDEEPQAAQPQQGPSLFLPTVENQE